MRLEHNKDDPNTRTPKIYDVDSEFASFPIADVCTEYVDLFCASPDLLAACKSAAETLTYYSEDPVSEHTCEQLRAAIAKAEDK